MSMEILLGVFIVLTISFGISYYATFKQYKKISEELSALMIVNFTMQEIIKNYDPSVRDDLEHKENFIKFLSDSREWAFDYIEKVQSGLKDFIEIADKEFSYFDQYGIVGSAYPHYNTLVKISAEYKKLKQLLPQEVKDV